jgi:hypothetical protein
LDACRAGEGQPDWRAFEARGVQPEELGLSDRQEVYDMVRTVKRKLLAALRETVRDTVEEPADVDPELAEVRRCLSL